MIKVLRPFLSLLLLLFCGGTIDAQTYVIPDENFRNYLVNRVPSVMNENNELIISQAKWYDGDISCNNLGIEDLSGIEFFHNIFLLNCAFNAIRFIPDLDSLTRIRQFWAYNNQLETLPRVNHLKLLEVLNIKNNNLTSVPSLEGLTALQEFDCSGNELHSLPELNTLVNLEYFYCYDNSITTIPAITNLRSLQLFDVQENKLVALPDISENTAIQLFRCDNNFIDSIPPINHMSGLVEFGFSNNRVSVFPDFSDNTAISTIHGSGNDVVSLSDLSVLSNLSEVRLSTNFLTFSEILPLINYPGFETIFHFQPQKEFLKREVIETIIGGELEIDVNTDSGVDDLVYTWYKDGVEVQVTESSVLFVSEVDDSFAGVYTCSITSRNNLLSNIVLNVGTFEVKVNPCLSIRSVNYQIEQNSCGKGASISIDDEGVSGYFPPFSYSLHSSVGDSPTYSGVFIENIQPGLYTLKIEDASACIVSLHNFVNIPNPGGCTNSFTPNGDGLEDTFFIEKTGNAKIYDKTGRLIRTLSSPTHWDGKNNEGMVVPIGLYIILVNETERTEVVVID